MADDPEAIRKGIEQTRRQMGETVSALADAASPKNMARAQADRARDMARARAEDIAAKARGTLEDGRVQLHARREQLRARGDGTGLHLPEDPRSRAALAVAGVLTVALIVRRLRS
jgi:hypothetical protein